MGDIHNQQAQGCEKQRATPTKQHRDGHLPNKDSSVRESCCQQCTRVCRSLSPANKSGIIIPTRTAGVMKAMINAGNSFTHSGPQLIGKMADIIAGITIIRTNLDL